MADARRLVAATRSAVESIASNTSSINRADWKAIPSERDNSDVR